MHTRPGFARRWFIEARKPVDKIKKASRVAKDGGRIYFSVDQHILIIEFPRGNDMAQRARWLPARLDGSHGSPSLHQQSWSQPAYLGSSPQPFSVQSGPAFSEAEPPTFGALSMGETYGSPLVRFCVQSFGVDFSSE